MDPGATKAENDGEHCELETVHRWVVHPFAANPLRVPLVVGFLGVLLFLIYQLMGNLWWVLFAGAVLFVSLRQFFFPTTFRLTDQDVSYRFLWIEQKRSWDQFRSYWIDRNGVLLSPFARRSRLETFRGFYLIGANRRPDVLAYIEAKIEKTRSP